MAWEKAVAFDRLQRDGRAVAKIGKRQIALFKTDSGILACNNRCPHEGYPLREGSLDGGCVLTCNWHNWKFDLKTGANLTGGDALRTYATKVEAGEVWIDVVEAPATERQAQALANLREAFEDESYDRMARELARYAKAGGDPVEAVSHAIAWSHDRLEFGTVHAYPAAAGWLRLHDESNDPEMRLICLLEAIGYMSDVAAGEEVYVYPEASMPWDEPAFLAAIEAEDEKGAIARVRGALDAGLGFVGLEHALSAAALAHYQDFGHSLIYVVHTGRLVQRLGRSVELPLLLALVRSLVAASREDLIPEFRAYAGARQAFPTFGANGTVPEPAQFRGRSVKEALAAVVGAAGRSAPETLYRSLLAAAAEDMLLFDTSWGTRTDTSYNDNIGWLDFTHGLTFANAVRQQCARYPELWPAGLLQIACFTGRNAGYTAKTGDGDWHVSDRDAFYADCIRRISDHGEDRYILAAHLLKTFLAVREEVAAGLPAEIETSVLAGLNRFFNAPLKRKHVRRTAHQALDFVAQED
ncbi:MAG: Rieske 2Fe-2S domain-containing protein [Alphaproteobacteria bacterium]|nr:Rieske 2Fe-2S domain-containing protein [Alphaproteobacteria bacterium]